MVPDEGIEPPTFGLQNRCSKAPELQAQFEREGAATVEMSTAEFGEYIKTEIEKWGRVVKEGNIHSQ